MLKFTQKRQSVTRLVAPVALAVTLAACSTTSLPENVNIAAPATQSVDQYLVNAESSEGSRVVDWHILALKAMIRDGLLPQADRQLDSISQMRMDPKQTAEWQISKATLRYQQGHLQQALDSLNLQSWWQLEDQQYRRYYQLRTQLANELNQPVLAARSRIALSPYLDEEQKEANWQAVWSLLSRLDSNTLMATPLADDESALRGWIQLRLLEDRYASSPLRLKDELDSWMTQNRFHPAINYMPSRLQAINDMDIQQAQHVALVLPLNGRYARQGDAVRDGFFAAMLEDSERDNNVQVSVFDSTAQSMPDLVNTMYNAGIDYVVGPLIKDDISAFQQANSVNFPTLALNIPDDIPSGINACYFTLSPENEAQQAAIHLYNNGYKFPLLLGPQSGYGERVSAAFNEQWQQLTGLNADVQYYRKRQELQQKINQVFGLTDSQARIDQMTKLTGLDMESEQRSRRDIDSVYMIATQAELTLLKPFIEVAINPGAKVPALFTSSRSNTIDSREDQLFELQGVEFSDIPLLISDPAQFQPRIEELWPDTSASTMRLMALGMDAYLLTHELPQMQVIDSHSAAGQTGILSIGEQCIINRDVEWAKVTGKTIEAVQ